MGTREDRLAEVRQDVIDKALSFRLCFRELSTAINTSANLQGFWSTSVGENKAEKIALMHSELSEALEGIRKNLPSDHLPGFLMETEELADCIIRIMDYAQHFDLPLADAITEKVKFNTTREYLHGKKF